MQKLIWKILYSIKLITNFITHTILLSSSILLPIQETNINITYTVGFFYFDFFFRNGNNSLIWQDYIGTTNRVWRNGLELHLKVHLFKLPTKLIAVAVPTQPWRGIWPFILRSQQREICRVPVTIKWLTYCNWRTTQGIFHTLRVFVQCSFLTENIFTNVARLKILKKDVYKFYVRPWSLGLLYLTLTSLLLNFPSVSWDVICATRG